MYANRESFLSSGVVPVDKDGLDADDQACSICSRGYHTLDGEASSEGPVQVSRCGHVFGRDCLTEWLAHSNTCPLDRGALFSTAPTYQAYRPADLADDDFDSDDDDDAQARPLPLPLPLQRPFHDPHRAPAALAPRPSTAAADPAAESCAAAGAMLSRIRADVAARLAAAFAGAISPGSPARGGLRRLRAWHAPAAALSVWLRGRGDDGLAGERAVALTVALGVAEQEEEEEEEEEGPVGPLGRVARRMAGAARALVERDWFFQLASGLAEEEDRQVVCREVGVLFELVGDAYVRGVVRAFAARVGPEEEDGGRGR